MSENENSPNEPNSPKTVTSALASLIVEADLSGMAAPAIETVKRAFLDTVAVAIAGATDEGSRIIVETVRELGGRPECSVISSGFRANVLDAAQANGTLAHALDFDDVNPSVRGHPSTTLVPATLALGEKLGASGRRVIEAFIIGLEVMARIGRGVNPEHYQAGWHCTSTLGSLGCAAAAARLHKLDVRQTQHGLAIACSMAAGLKQNFGTMTKPMHAGNAARGGILAATLASKGFTGGEGILDAPLGFPRVFADIAPEAMARALEGLGEDWEITTVGLSVKLYPCCAGTHRSIDAMLQLIREHELRPEQIDKVAAGECYLAEQLLIYPKPTTPLEAKFSMPYALAACLVDRTVGLAQFTPEKVLAPRTRELMERISMYVHPDLRTKESLAHRFALVTATLRDGRVLECRVDAPSGDPSCPPSREQIIDKFWGCVGDALPREKAERLLDALERLDTLKNVRGLVALAANIDD